MKEQILHFLKSGAIGGVFIGLYSVLIKYASPSIAAQLNGALPTGFLFIILYSYFIKSREKTINANFMALIGGFLWLAYVGLFYYLLKKDLNIFLILFITTSVFLVLSYFVYKKFIDYY